MRRECTGYGKDALAGEIKICRHRIAMAETIGWPALIDSWTRTLQEKLHDYEMRKTDEPGPTPDSVSDSASNDVW